MARLGAARMPLTGQVPPNLAGPNGLWDGLPEPPDTGARSSAQRSQPPREFLAQAVRPPRSYNHTRRACRGYVKVMEVMWRPPGPQEAGLEWRGGLPQAALPQAVLPQAVLGIRGAAVRAAR